MSETIGPIHLAASHDEVFLGRDLMRKRNISQALANKLDKEISKIVNTAYAKAMQLLKDNIEYLHKIAERLIKHETVTGQEILDILESAPQSYGI
jgi:cell division protease FtsH